MAGREIKRWRIEPGTAVDLSKWDPGATDGAPGPERPDGARASEKSATEATFGELRHELRELQERLWAQRQESLLIVLQAIDGGGKDGIIKHVFRGVNATGARVASFKAPTEEELAHDFLWRVHRQTPADGEVVVFNRSHYEDVLVVRVRQLVPEDVWRPRYELINQFEHNLAQAGTHVVKLFLHISKEEQAERFRSRLADPTKRWKFRRGDLEERKLWDDYQVAFAEAIERTSTEEAPWFIVPADRKWYRNWAVSQILLDALEGINPQYPPGEDVEDVVIE